MSLLSLFESELAKTKKQNKQKTHQVTHVLEPVWEIVFSFRIASETVLYSYEKVTSVTLCEHFRIDDT